jgi:hypothetical protein
MKIAQGKQEVYEEWKAKNEADPYGAAILRYAHLWADLMEAELRRGNKLEDIADSTSHTADTEGITGFMYGCAISFLSYCWEHGEALRRWHNIEIQIGDEGERANEKGAVLNPAIMVIGS